MHRTLCSGCLFASFLAACGSPPPAAPGEDGGAPRLCASDEDCDDGRFCNGVERCLERTCQPGTPPCAGDLVCHEASARCIDACGLGVDEDGDGAQSPECGGDDCDDADPRRYPGNVEVCDLRGSDEDCDPATFGERDADGDGHTDARCCNDDAGTSRCGDDCNDGRSDVHPGATEVCNGVDDDCDGAADEGTLVVAYVDADHDLHGELAMPRMACPGTAGVASLGDDCDDADPRRHPAQVEICDGRDNDCDASIDESPQSVTWYADLDGDGFGSVESGTLVSCAPPPGYELRATDCDDALAGVHPGAAEACNARDDDCNGRADHTVAPGDLEDDDADGFADAACERGGDCDDLDPATGPGMPEVCDGRDNDCDGVSDDATSDASWYPDRDGDGWGDGRAAPTVACAPPRGFVLRIGDCDDSIPSRHPFAPDDCNARDDDCDGSVDEDAPRVAYFRDGDADGFGDASGPVLSCTSPAGLIPIGGDCDDAEAARHPGAPEICDGDDDDCDGLADEGFPTVSCGVGACRRTVASCDGARPVPCVPGSPSPEDCNGIDDDCDGEVDDEPGASAACSSTSTIGACVSGACTVRACIPGFDDCNGVASDGCETDLGTSNTSCGSCGHACRGGRACDARSRRCETEPYQITAGDVHTCVLLGNGSVYCWGGNASGQLANGTLSAALRATPTAFPAEVSSVAAGYEHTCVVTSAGAMHCAGNNEYDQISVGAADTVPTAVQVTPFTDWTFVDAGWRSTCGLRSSGLVSCFGGEWAGALGVECGTGNPCREDRAFVYAGTVASRVDTGGVATVVLQIAPEVRVAGVGRSNAFGYGTGYRWYPPWGEAYDQSMQVVRDAVSVCTGHEFSCLVRASGEVLCTGDNSVGQLGTMASSGTDRFTLVPGLTDAVRVDCGHSFACATGRDGSIWCWGQSGEGQILGASGPFRDAPVRLADLPGRPVALALGRMHACAILDSQQVVCWGNNAVGQLGVNDTLEHPRMAVFVQSLP